MWTSVEGYLYSCTRAWLRGCPMSFPARSKMSDVRSSNDVVMGCSSAGCLYMGVPRSEISMSFCRDFREISVNSHRNLRLEWPSVLKLLRLCDSLCSTVACEIFLLHIGHSDILFEHSEHDIRWWQGLNMISCCRWVNLRTREISSKTHYSSVEADFTIWFVGQFLFQILNFCLFFLCLHMSIFREFSLNFLQVGNFSSNNVDYMIRRIRQPSHKNRLHVDISETRILLWSHLFHLALVVQFVHQFSDLALTIWFDLYTSIEICHGSISIVHHRPDTSCMTSLWRHHENSEVVTSSDSSWYHVTEWGSECVDRCHDKITWRVRAYNVDVDNMCTKITFF